MLTLYDYLPSGNGYKVRLLLSQLGRRFRLVEKDIVNGETRRPDFLALNPNGRIPLIRFEDGRCLAESGAMLWHFAEGTPFLSSDPFERALTLQWMFFEQYSHEPNIATARHWIQHLGGRAKWTGKIEEKIERGHQALAVMESHLRERAYFVGERYSIADIALYAYTHVAEEGEFDLSRYPAVRRWLDRVAGQPGHVPITQGVFD
ncbi:MAG: glutathione S-transferase family protein [Alphaproteobacteria bacterium]|nr:glutathione S-transferase family protein [Alphaproteobacteria bacterium]